MVPLAILGIITIYVTVFVCRVLAQSIREVSKWDRRNGDR